MTRRGANWCWSLPDANCQLTVQDREFALHLANELVASGQLDIVDHSGTRRRRSLARQRPQCFRPCSANCDRLNEFMATENIRMLSSVERILSSE